MTWIFDEFGVSTHHSTHEFQERVSYFVVIDVKILIWIRKFNIKSQINLIKHLRIRYLLDVLTRF